MPPGLVLSWTTSRGANVLIWHRPKGEIGKLLGRTSISAPPPWLGTAQNLLWCCVICFSVQTELKRCLHSYQVMKHKTRIIEAGSTYIKDDTSRIKDELKALEVSVKLRSRYSIWMSLTKCKFMSEMTLTTFMFWVGKHFLFRAMAYYHWLFIWRSRPADQRYASTDWLRRQVAF